MTAAEELALINTAIESILTGKVQSYTINGRAVTRLDLADLWQRKKELEAAVARESSGSFLLARFRNAD